MTIGHVSGSKWADEESNEEIAQHSGQPKPPADRAGERRREQHNTNLENRGSFRHGIRLVAGTVTGRRGAGPARRDGAALLDERLRPAGPIDARAVGQGAGVASSEERSVAPSHQPGSLLR